MVVPILCTHTDTNYLKLSQNSVSQNWVSQKPVSQELQMSQVLVDCYDKIRDAYTFNGSQKIIAHPPCQQWSKLKGCAKKDDKEKQLALFCYDLVNRNGGILEHPLGSSLFDYVGANKKNIFLIHQHVFGFPAQKPTLLYVKDVELLPIPSHNPGTIANLRNVNQLTQHQRSKMTKEFCLYLINSLIFSNT